MKTYNESFTLSAREFECIDLTRRVEELVSKSSIKNGLVNVFAPHATGVIVITEYESALLNDIKEALKRLVPRNIGYGHPNNAHSHIMSALLTPSKTIPLINGRLALGTWQSIFWIEVDTHPRQRTIILQIIGE